MVFEYLNKQRTGALVKAKRKIVKVLLKYNPKIEVFHSK